MHALIDNCIIFVRCYLINFRFRVKHVLTLSIFFTACIVECVGNTKNEIHSYSTSSSSLVCNTFLRTAYIFLSCLQSNLISSFNMFDCGPKTQYITGQRDKFVRYPFHLLV